MALTLLGLGGFPASHPLCLGMMGMHGEACVNTAIQEADLLLAFGMRFDDRVTGNAGKTYALQREEDPRRDRPQPRSTRTCPWTSAWSAICARSLDDAAAAGAGRRSRRLARAHRRPQGRPAVRDIQNLPDSGHLYAAHVIHDLWRETKGEAVVVTDVGQHQMWEAQYYHHEKPRTLITSGGLGTMGFALPAAIGAKIARPDAEVWVVVGDGGFQMTQCELATMRRRSSTSRSRSSTTATWAWSASGRSSSTRSATPPRHAVAPTS